MQIRQIAAIALVLLGAVACTSAGSDGQTSAPTSTLPTRSPAPASTTPSSPPTSATPTPTVATTGPNVRPGEKPPTVEVAARHNTPAGADAYARYWMRTIDWAYATTTSDLARAAFAASCEQCDHFLTFDIDQIRTKRQHYINGRLAVEASQLIPTDGHAGATAIVDLKVMQQPFKLLSESGTTVDQAISSTTVTFRTWLQWISGWRVVDWKTVTNR